MNWAKIWLKVFGTTTWMGLDMGFWVSTGIALLVAIIMNIVFWSMKPYDKTKANKEIKN